MIPNGRPLIEQEDIKAVNEVLISSWLTTGPKVSEFEEKFAQYVDSRYAIAVSSGTAALELAIMALNLEEGSEIITTPQTFVATANAIIYNKLKPIFVDIQSDTLNIDPDQVKKAVTLRTKAILFVDYAGQPCDITELRNIANQHNLFLIEDASHAVGAEYKNQKIGSIADLTTFSFHPVKNMTTGEGGMVTTNNIKWYDKICQLRNHGLDKSDKKFGGDWSYNLKSLGRNFRLTDFQCALGISQLEKLEFSNKRRREIVEIYKRELSSLDEVTFLEEKEDRIHAHHLLVILLNGIDRNQLFTKLKERNVSANVHYIPIYNFDYYKKFDIHRGRFPVTEETFKKMLTLPLHAGMTNQDVEHVITSVKQSIVELMEGKIMKIVVVGSGSIGKRHIRNLKKIFEKRGDGSEVIAFDVNAEALKLIEEEYKVRITTNIDEAFVEADGVFICTPNYLHASLALKAVQNNCHVLIEKPMAHDLDNVEELLNIAKEKNLTVTVGYMLRYYEPLKKVKELLGQEKIGKIYGAIVECGSYLPGWRPTQDYRRNYGAMKSQGGGVILDSIHEINYIKYLLGEVESVFALTDKRSDLEIDTEDYASISLKFKSGVIANVHLDYLQRSYSRRCKIIGEKGTIEWDFVGHKVRIFDANKNEWSETSLENLDFNKTYLAEEKHFVDCISGVTQPLIDGKEGKQDVLICLAAKESAESGKLIRLEEFHEPTA